MKLEKIFKNNKKWAEEKLLKDPDFFKNLSEGQHPEILYIGCSDSRTPAEEFMVAGPGELFVHRNVANLVIGTDSNLDAAVQFAVGSLKVRHIVVCGHYECGGIKAALQPQDHGKLNGWLQTLRDVYQLHHKELDAIDNLKKREDRFAELNVFRQCLNVMKIDHVQKSIFETGLPEIHGWIFDIRTGLLKNLEPEIAEKIQNSENIYQIFGKQESND